MFCFVFVTVVFFSAVFVQPLIFVSSQGSKLLFFFEFLRQLKVVDFTFPSLSCGELIDTETVLRHPGKHVDEAAGTVDQIATQKKTNNVIKFFSEFKGAVQITQSSHSAMMSLFIAD